MSRMASSRTVQQVHVRCVGQTEPLCTTISPAHHTWSLLKVLNHFNILVTQFPDCHPCCTEGCEHARYHPAHALSIFGVCPAGDHPSSLYGKYTWRVPKFSDTSKRELRSKSFTVGDYRFYILVYPNGCDVCNHLSLFLCVADYDNLLPGVRFATCQLVCVGLH